MTHLLCAFSRFSDVSTISGQDHYEGHLAKFLNDYMHTNQNPSNEWIEEKRKLFMDTVKCVSEGIFVGKTPQKLSITFLEALLVGVGSNLPDIMDTPRLKLARSYKNLSENAEFTEGALREGLSKKQRVISRLNAAVKLFAS